MKATAIFGVALVGLMLAMPVSAQSMDVDLKAADGVTLKATYSSPGRPGPGMLLIHQCNMDRKSWAGITAELVSAGIHVLTLDLRGFGDSGGEGMSGGFPTLLQKSAGDSDMAFEYLAAQSGVDRARMGVGGASCGGMINGDLAARKEGVQAAERDGRAEYGREAWPGGLRCGYRGRSRDPWGGRCTPWGSCGFAASELDHEDLRRH